MAKIIYRVFSYSKKIGKYNINFVRIGRVFGWWCKFKGKNYGAYTECIEEKLNQKICKETFQLLEQQAEETIKELNNKYGKKNKDNNRNTI